MEPPQPVRAARLKASVRINASVQFGKDMGVSHIVGGVHAAVFFIDIPDCKAIIYALPAGNQLGGVVGRAVVNNQPFKILAGLTAKTLIGARYGVCAVVDGSKYGECGHKSKLNVGLFSQKEHHESKSLVGEEREGEF